MHDFTLSYQSVSQWSKGQSKNCTKKKFSMKDIFSRYVQIHNYIRIFLRLIKKSLMENFIFLCNETNYDQGSGYVKRVIWFIHLSITMMFVKGLQQLFIMI